MDEVNDLPAGWEKRVCSLGVFGLVDALFVDPMDVVLSKMFSAGERTATTCARSSDSSKRRKLAERLRDTCEGLLKAPDLRENRGGIGTSCSATPCPPD